MSRIKSVIDANIRENGKGEITGKKLNYVLNEMVSAGQPNWVADEGEDGFIKNKTHGLSGYIGVLNAGNTSLEVPELVYCKYGNTIKELYDSDIWELKIWDESVGRDYLVTITHTGVSLTMQGDADKLYSAVQVYGSLSQLSEAYLDYHIARYSDLEELWNEIGYLYQTTQWHGVVEEDVFNNIGVSLTEEQMQQMGFGQVIVNPYDIKGVIIEGDGRSMALAVSCIQEQGGLIYCITFGNITRYDTGAELTLARNFDNTWEIHYEES